MGEFTHALGVVARARGMSVVAEQSGLTREALYKALRTPNGEQISADKVGVAVTDCGFIGVDIQMRTNVPHIFTIGEIALAIEMGADAVDFGKTIHPHPTPGESIGMAAEVAHASCTDLPPVRQ